MRAFILVLLAFSVSPLFADKELKENFKEIGHGFKKVVKGAGKAVRTTVKKTGKWLDKKDGDDKEKK